MQHTSPLSLCLLAATLLTAAPASAAPGQTVIPAGSAASLPAGTDHRLCPRRSGLFDRSPPAGLRRLRHFWTRCPHRLAYPSPRPDAHRHLRNRPHPGMGRTYQNHTPGRRDHLPAERNALAWRGARQRHDASRHRRARRRQKRDMDGKSHGRTVP